MSTFQTRCYNETRELVAKVHAQAEVCVKMCVYCYSYQVTILLLTQTRAAAVSEENESLKAHIEQQQITIADLVCSYFLFNLCIQQLINSLLHCVLTEGKAGAGSTAGRRTYA